MPYAVKQDILDRYPHIILPMIPDPGDPDGEDIVDDTAVEKALADGAAQIDPYLSARYALPVTGDVPLILVLLNVDIALYRMADDAPNDRFNQVCVRPPTLVPLAIYFDKNYIFRPDERVEGNTVFIHQLH